MVLSILIKKGGLLSIMTATPATVATHQQDDLATVAPVATVAVAGKLEPTHELLPAQESSILAWLAHIDETDPAVIAEVLGKCRSDLNAQRYFMQQCEGSGF